MDRQDFELEVLQFSEPIRMGPACRGDLVNHGRNAFDDFITNLLLRGFRRYRLPEQVCFVTVRQTPPGL
jgi:hypothetical protein